MTGLTWGPPAVRARRVLGLAAAVVIAFAAMALVASPAGAQTCSSDPDVQVDQDACSETVAVSGTGNASGTNCSGNVNCVSVSGTGQASNVDQCWGGIVTVQCVAISGANDASNGTGTGDRRGCNGGGGALDPSSAPASVSVNCVAVSGTGNASNSVGDTSCGIDTLDVNASCIAISGAGNASNSAQEGSCGANWISAGTACLAVSGAGNASNSAGPSSCSDAKGGGAAGVACVAISGAGDASNEATGADGDPGNGACGTGGFAVSVGCVAVSGAGSASNSAGADSCGKSDSGILLGAGEPEVGAVAVGCLAVSGTGSAFNSAGDNSCGYAVGAALGVGCVEVDGQDPVRVTVGGGHGCVVTAGYSCAFAGNGIFVPNGVIAATSGSWMVSHEVDSTTVIDAVGSGPSAFPFTFANGVYYTLSVGSDGSGVVAAGSPT